MDDAIRMPYGPDAAGPDPTEAPARRVRVLVVEDDVLVGADTALVLAAHGHDAVGPARSVAEALRAVAQEAPIDAALLDVDLAGETSGAVADALAARGIPFALLTGRPDGLPGHAGVPVVLKPAPHRLVLAVVAALLARRR
jgi:CheY-like chemotaxis protein